MITPCSTRAMQEEKKAQKPPLYSLLAYKLQNLDLTYFSEWNIIFAISYDTETIYTPPMFTEDSTVEDLLVFIKQNYDIPKAFSIDFRYPSHVQGNITPATILSELLDLAHMTPAGVFKHKKVLLYPIDLRLIEEK